MVALTTKKRWNGTAFVDLTVSKRWDGTAFVDFFSGAGSGLSATADTGYCSGLTFEPEPAPTFVVVPSNSVTVTPIGGTAPYTHAWTLVSGHSAILPVAPTAATTYFEATIGKNQEKHAVYRDTITDALAATTTVDIVVDLSYFTDI